MNAEPRLPRRRIATPRAMRPPANARRVGRDRARASIATPRRRFARAIRRRIRFFALPEMKKRGGAGGRLARTCITVSGAAPARPSPRTISASASGLTFLGIVAMGGVVSWGVSTIVLPACCASALDFLTAPRGMSYASAPHILKDTLRRAHASPPPRRRGPRSARRSPQCSHRAASSPLPPSFRFGRDGGHHQLPLGAFAPPRLSLVLARPSRRVASLRRWRVFRSSG